MNAKQKQLDRVAEIAAKAALEFLEKEKQNQQKAKRDRRLRNIKLLLRKYRSFKLHCEDLKIKLEKELEAEDLDEELAVNAIRKSKERTLAMVRFIDKMLEVYKTLCEKSGKPEEMRRYNIVYQMYISEEKVSAEEIAAGQNVNLRTVYKDIDHACKTLSTLIFGVDSIRFFD